MGITRYEHTCAHRLVNVPLCQWSRAAAYWVMPHCWAHGKLRSKAQLWAASFPGSKPGLTPSLTLYSQRRQIAAKPKPCTDNKKKSDADPNFPDCTETLGSPGHPMVWTGPLLLECWQQLVPTMAVHGTISSHSPGRAPSRQHQRELEQSRMAQCAAHGKLTEWPCS